jgi:hypothetical protein
MDRHSLSEISLHINKYKKYVCLLNFISFFSDYHLSVSSRPSLCHGPHLYKPQYTHRASSRLGSFVCCAANLDSAARVSDNL